MRYLFITSLILTFSVSFCWAERVCPFLKDGAPVGIQCLHCMHPKAKKFTPLLTKAILNSCRKQVAVAYILDSSFGFDPEVIRAQVSKLLNNQREVYLHLYVINGPAQRRWTLKTFSGFANQIPPDIFRAQIIFDKKLRFNYSKLVSRIAPLVSEMIALGVHVSVCPMLEDNLSNQAFDSILTLTRDTLLQNVTYFRSVCGDCYAGNETGVPPGVKMEIHRISKGFSLKDGIISNDGWGYVYFSNADKVILQNPVIHSDRKESVVSLNDLRPILKRSRQLNNIFLLWISKYQQTYPGSRSLPPSKRNFPRPKDSELNSISSFLDSK